MIEQLAGWAQIISTAFTLTIAPLAWLVWKIRTNDLQHIDEKLEGLREGQSRIEEKLDQHIQWHMGYSVSRKGE